MGNSDSIFDKTLQGYALFSRGTLCRNTFKKINCIAYNLCFKVFFHHSMKDNPSKISIFRVGNGGPIVSASNSSSEGCGFDPLPNHFTYP